MPLVRIPANFLCSLFDCLLRPVFSIVYSLRPILQDLFFICRSPAHCRALCASSFGIGQTATQGTAAPVPVPVVFEYNIWRIGHLDLLVRCPQTLTLTDQIREPTATGFREAVRPSILAVKMEVLHPRVRRLETVTRREVVKWWTAMWCRNVDTVQVAHVVPVEKVSERKPSKSQQQPHRRLANEFANGTNSGGEDRSSSGGGGGGGDSTQTEWRVSHWQPIPSSALLGLRCPPKAPVVEETVLISENEVRTYISEEYRSKEGESICVGWGLTFRGVSTLLLWLPRQSIAVGQSRWVFSVVVASMCHAL